MFQFKFSSAIFIVAKYVKQFVTFLLQIKQPQ